MRRLFLPLALVAGLLAIPSSASALGDRNCGTATANRLQAENIVSSRNIYCSRARGLARYWLRSGRAPKGWHASQDPNGFSVTLLKGRTSLVLFDAVDPN